MYGQHGRVLRAERSAGQISGKCHRLGSAFSSGQTTTPYQAHKTSTSGSAPSKAATSVGRPMPLSDMYYLAAKMATRPHAQEERRQEANRDRPRGNQQSIHFLRQGKAPQNTDRRPAPNLLTSEAEWRNGGGPRRQLQSTREISSITLWPDMMLWTPAGKSALLTELTVPW